MKKSFVVLLHIGFWACYFILVMVMLGMYFRGAEEMESRISNAFIILFYFALLPSFFTFYGYYLVLFPNLRKKKAVPSIIYGFVIPLIAGFISYVCLYLYAGPECIDDPESGFWGDIELIFFIAFISAISGIVSLIIRGFISWFEEIKLKEALKEQNHEMEMALVKSQLDPHFLFNTINNIDVLILKNATHASEYLNKLSDIMRFMLFETKTEKILLTKEIEYIEKYIELQKIRTSNANYVNLSINGTLNGQTIAPMVFIPFIENAFKHTSNKKLMNAIVIDVLVEKNKVQLFCKNKLDRTRKIHQDRNSIGNELIKKRLELIYPEKHELTIENQEDYYSVKLNIDTSEKTNY